MLLIWGSSWLSMLMNSRAGSRRMGDAVLFEEDGKQLGGQQFALGQDVFAERFAKGDAQDDMEEFEVFGDDGRPLARKDPA
jgi:hypothetical protein